MADDDQDLGATEEIPVDERPAWLPANFDKPEDLAKSWTHANSKITEQGTELSQLRSQMEELQAAQYTQQAQTQSQDIEQQLYDAYESGDGRAIAAANAFLIQQSQEALKKEILAANQQPRVDTEIVAAYAEQQVASKYQDWPELRAKVGEVIGADPFLREAIAGETSPTKVAGYLETAYKLAKYESGQTAASQVDNTLAELNRQVKNQAQTMTGTNSTEEAESYWDTVKAAKSGIPSFGR